MSAERYQEPLEVLTYKDKVTARKAAIITLDAEISRQPVIPRFTKLSSPEVNST